MSGGEGAGPLEVEVIFAGAEGVVRRTYALQPGSRMSDALALAAADPAFERVAILEAAVGIFGRRVGTEEMLRHGDRVEIYRPLQADPKSARRTRAQAAVRSKIPRA